MGEARPMGVVQSVGVVQHTRECSLWERPCVWAWSSLWVWPSLPGSSPPHPALRCWCAPLVAQGPTDSPRRVPPSAPLPELALGPATPPTGLTCSLTWGQCHPEGGG